MFHIMLLREEEYLNYSYAILLGICINNFPLFISFDIAFLLASRFSYLL